MIHRMQKSIFSIAVALTLMAVGLNTQAAVLQTQAATPTAQEALTYFQNQNWANAAKAYQAIIEREPNNGVAWFRYAHCLHSLGKYEEAVKAYLRTVEINKHPHAPYNLACSYARLGDKEKAFEWLMRALQTGFNQPEQIRIDEDLASLRTDARFKEVVAGAERNANPCGQAEHQQFNFWVGEWEVTSGGKPVAQSSIQQIVGSCVIFENYSDGSGMVGKSFNFYDSTLKKWRQTWVDNGGNVSEFSGEYKDGAMRYEGESHRRDGQRILRRMTVSPASEDRVRQHSEFSLDGGQTWKTNYDFLYVRKK